MQAWQVFQAACDTAVYGPVYAVMNGLGRHPLPHDPELLWDGINCKLPAIANRVNAHLTNFIMTGDPVAEYDRICSIGAWEHVRHDDVAGLLTKRYGALKPGERLVHHFFCPFVETVKKSNPRCH